jgi:tripartite-type tricarboxylate transporter receptor subunit TctC
MAQKNVLILALISFSVVWLCGHNLVWAQEEFPNKPITIVQPHEPGGLTDLPVRAMVDDLAKEFKVPMILEYKAGAASMLGISYVQRAKPDGYTLLAAGDSAMIIGPLQSPNPPFDSFKDFVSIGIYGNTVVAFGVHQSSPFKTLGEFVAEAKKNPGKLSVAITSLGNDNHFAFELFRKASGINVKMIPYKGPGEGVAAFLGRHVDMLVLSYVSFSPYVKSGEARLIAVGNPVPGSSIQSFAGTGYPAEFARVSAFYVSAKTPKPIYEKLITSFKRVVTNPEVTKKFEMVGLIPGYKSPDEFNQFMKPKWDAYSALMEELGMRKKAGEKKK